MFISFIMLPGIEVNKYIIEVVIWSLKADYAYLTPSAENSVNACSTLCAYKSKSCYWKLRKIGLYSFIVNNKSHAFAKSALMYFVIQMARWNLKKKWSRCHNLHRKFKNFILVIRLETKIKFGRQNLAVSNDQRHTLIGQKLLTF